MIYSKEFNVDTFPWWTGAKDTIAEVKKHNKMDELQQLIEDTFAARVPNRIPTATEVNDLVWFESSWILTHLGIEDDDK